MLCQLLDQLIYVNMFYTASADDETMLAATRLEDWRYLDGIIKDCRMKTDWKSRNGFIWP